MHASATATRCSYESLGGETGIHRLVCCFFEQMQRRPTAARIRKMHGENLEPITQKLTAFLINYLRAPGQRRSPSILALAHFGFSIGADERDEWLACMRAALGDVEVPNNVAEELLQELRTLADTYRSDSDMF